MGLTVVKVENKNVKRDLFKLCFSKSEGQMHVGDDVSVEATHDTMNVDA